jgi:hypothetical protein
MSSYNIKAKQQVGYGQERRQQAQKVKPDDTVIGYLP